MHDFFTIMLAPFLECLVLVGIHSYLGLHVLRRRVIFVDLSLAQIAALGTTVGILFGIYDTESHASFLISMSFTFVGAAIFALSRFQDERVPQEAIIGLVYAITAAIAVLVVDKTKGSEHLMSIMHGRLLWVKWSEIAWAALAYSAVGLLHYLFRHKFLLISDDPEKAFRQGIPVRLWDFFFYLTFGFVITFSVKVAGVLLVFVFLVAPAIIAFLFTSDLKRQLIIGWSTGTAVAVVGIWLSWALDWPSGPTVVSLYGVVLLLVALAHYVLRAPARGQAMGRLGQGLLVTGVLGALLYFGGIFLARSPLAGESAAHAARVAQAESRLRLQQEPVPPGASHLDLADAVVGSASGESRPTSLVQRYSDAETCLDRVGLLEEAHEAQPAEAIQLTSIFLADGESSPFCRSSALELLKKWTGQDFGIREDLGPAENLEAIWRLSAWIQAHEASAAHE